MNLRTASGYTSLHLAVKSGYIECIKLLLSLGANVNLCIEAENLNGATALFLAVKTNQSIDIINLLIAEGADVDMVDSEHVSPFQIASFCGNVDASKALMEAGAIITVEDVRVSELRGHLELVKMVRKSRGKPTNGEYPAKKCGKGLFARFF